MSFVFDPRTPLMAGRLKVLKVLILLLITANSGWISAQYYGMSFSGMSVSLDQRSSLMLTPGRALNAGSDLSLRFHLQFAPFSGANYGYVFRLLIGDKNIWSTNITIRTVQCRVVLLGIVGSKIQINRAINHAKSVQNVRSVKSFLRSAQ